VSLQQPKGSNNILNPLRDIEDKKTSNDGLSIPSVGKIIFGSRLAGPAARSPPNPEMIRIVEGIKVPPRPEEPDNCCMSYVAF
jgi:Oxidoreductase-like protein, N-terminal